MCLPPSQQRVRCAARPRMDARLAPVGLHAEGRVGGPVALAGGALGAALPRARLPARRRRRDHRQHLRAALRRPGAKFTLAPAARSRHCCACTGKGMRHSPLCFTALPATPRVDAVPFTEGFAGCGQPGSREPVHLARTQQGVARCGGRTAVYSPARNAWRQAWRCTLPLVVLRIAPGLATTTAWQATAWCAITCSATRHAQPNSWVCPDNVFRDRRPCQHTPPSHTIPPLTCIYHCQRSHPALLQTPAPHIPSSAVILPRATWPAHAMYNSARRAPSKRN